MQTKLLALPVITWCPAQNMIYIFRVYIFQFIYKPLQQVIQQCDISYRKIFIISREAITSLSPITSTKICSRKLAEFQSDCINQKLRIIFWKQFQSHSIGIPSPVEIPKFYGDQVFCVLGFLCSWKHHGFLIFSGGTERDLWHDQCNINNGKKYYFIHYANVISL